jgi:hypothetical protein
VANYLRLKKNPNTTARTTGSGLGIELLGGTVELTSGEHAGTILAPDSIIKANQRIVINAGEIWPNKYHVILQPNPILYYYGTVSCPTIIEPEDHIPLDVTVRMDKQFALADLNWVLRMYLID